jgi:hypothetical protein
VTTCNIRCHVGALGTLERPLAWQILDDVLLEMGQQVLGLGADLVDARLKLLSTKLAAAWKSKANLHTYLCIKDPCHLTKISYL